MAKFWLRVAVLTALLIGNVYVFMFINEKLKPACMHRSQQLEYVADPRIAEQIVNDWNHHGVRRWAAAGIWADMPFIVIYVLLSVVVLKQCAGALPQIPRWQPVGHALSGAAVLAGTFDFAENVGMLLELYRRWFSVAPIVALIAMAKFMLLALVLLYAVLTLLLKMRIYAAGNDQKLIDEVADFV